MKKAWLAVVFGSALFLAACGGDDEATKTDNGTTDTDTEQTAGADGEKIVKETCVSCHGQNLEGMGAAPSLADVGSRRTEDEILNIINNGTTKGMPAGLIKGADAEAAAAWLATQK